MEENLSAAFSQIFDADVAEENSRLVHSQILANASVSSVLLAGPRVAIIRVRIVSSPLWYSRDPPPWPFRTEPIKRYGKGDKSAEEGI